MEGAKALYQDPEFTKWATEDEPKFCSHPGVTKRIVVLGNPYVIYQM